MKEDAFEGGTARCLAALVLLPALLAPAISWAHGARVSWSLQDGSISIRPAYDDGTPMIEAQVVVYSPADPEVPWLRGETDDTGRFAFTPDPEETGTWDVQVRKAGHGDIVHIEMSRGQQRQAGEAPRLSTIQIILMALCVAWGFVGTALYFRYRIRSRSAHS